jgi:hypothetical protein
MRMRGCALLPEGVGHGTAWQFALVTGNDTDTDYVANATDEEGTSTHGMYVAVSPHA